MNFASLFETFLATTWKRVVCLLGLGLLGLAFVSFYQTGIDRARAEAEIQSREALIKAQDRTIAQLDLRVKARDEEAAQAKKELKALQNRPATVRQIAVEIPRFIPLPRAQAFKPFDLKPGDEPMTRSSDGQIIFDAQQAQSLRTFYLGCAEQKIDLTAYQRNLADIRGKAEAQRLRAELFRDQRDAAVRGMKGGSHWQQFVRNSKILGIGIVVGFAGGVALTR